MRRRFPSAGRHVPTQKSPRAWRSQRLANTQPGDAFLRFGNDALGFRPTWFVVAAREETEFGHRANQAPRIGIRLERNSPPRRLLHLRPAYITMTLRRFATTPRSLVI